MQIEPIAALGGTTRAQELAASYAQHMSQVRRPAIKDVLSVQGQFVQVLSVANGGERIEVEDSQGNRVTMTREPRGWWIRA